MALAKCEKCGTEISAKAEKCPKCGQLKPTKPIKMKPCRTCGAPLEVQYYRSAGFTPHTYLKDGNTMTGQSWSIDHRPCPKCGDPAPLKTFLFTPLGQMIVGSVMFIAIPYASFKLAMLFDGDASILALVIAFVIGEGALVMWSRKS